MNHKKRIQQIYNSRKRKRYKKKEKMKIINHKKLIQTDITYFIHCLPEDIKKRIYIFTWKMMWRDYVPLTAKIPSWHHHTNYVKNKLWEAQLNNIHFLHLPFNTLPENKKWIMGCQCDFCLNDTEVDVVEKHIHYLIQYRNSYYFTDNLMPNESISSWNEYLVPVYRNPFIDDNTILKKVFDPLCGSYKENYTSKRLREGGGFEFSYPF
jgi:hypothetical protein